MLAGPPIDGGHDAVANSSAGAPQGAGDDTIIEILREGGSCQDNDERPVGSRWARSPTGFRRMRLNY
jgi:hypothetical protein